MHASTRERARTCARVAGTVSGGLISGFLGSSALTPGRAAFAGIIGYAFVLVIGLAVHELRRHGARRKLTSHQKAIAAIVIPLLMLFVVIEIAGAITTPHH